MHGSDTLRSAMSYPVEDACVAVVEMCDAYLTGSLTEQIVYNKELELTFGI